MGDKTGASRLAARIRAANGRFVGGVGKILRDTSLVYAQELVYNTAVDTGETRSNWKVTKKPQETLAYDPESSSSVNLKPPYSPYPQYTDAEKFNETANAEGALGDIWEALQAITDKEIAKGRPFFITNPSWIAQALNDGTIQSEQPTEGFIDKARITANSYLSRHGKLFYV